MRLVVYFTTFSILFWQGVSHAGMYTRYPESRRVDLPLSTYRISGNMQEVGLETMGEEHHELSKSSLCPDCLLLGGAFLFQDTSKQRSAFDWDETVPHVASGKGNDRPEGSNIEHTDPDPEEITGIKYRPRWERWVRGQVIVVGFAVVGFGVVLLLPESVSRWEGDIYSQAEEKLRKAWTEPPVWDSDDWFLNYVAHPYFGALAHNLMRSQGGGFLESFIFGTVQSCLWEYVIEGVAEQPSIQDLIVTPIVGSALGELIHYGTLRMRRNGFSLFEKVVVTIINPPFIVNNGYN
jgi:hypothetical protein